MRARRYLAPWRGPSTGGSPAADPLAGKPAIYHCVSRVVEGRFVFGDAEKEQFVSYLRAYEAFSGLRVLTYCVMSNHFHVLVEVPEPPASAPSDDQLLERLAAIRPGSPTEDFRRQLAELRRRGDQKGAEELRQRQLRRMWDLSSFMKTLKQRFSQWYNGRGDRAGFLWSERFKSVLVEDGHAARVMAAYIDLNPVRAGIVARPEDYRWSGWGEAVAGKRMAREGLQRLMAEKLRGRMDDAQAAREAGDWRKTAAAYRRMMEDDVARRSGPQPSGGKRESGSDGGTAKLSEAELLRGRVRYFTDGLVVGSEQFVDAAFGATKERFGPKRKSGARKLAGADTGLRVMRALRVKPRDA